MKMSKRLMIPYIIIPEKSHKNNFLQASESFESLRIFMRRCADVANNPRELLRNLRNLSKVIVSNFSTLFFVYFKCLFSPCKLIAGDSLSYLMYLLKFEKIVLHSINFS